MQNSKVSAIDGINGRDNSLTVVRVPQDSADLFRHIFQPHAKTCDGLEVGIIGIEELMGLSGSFFLSHDRAPEASPLSAISSS